MALFRIKLRERCVMGEIDIGDGEQCSSTVQCVVVQQSTVQYGTVQHGVHAQVYQDDYIAQTF